jgi:signal transduction histidine kinase
LADHIPSAQPGDLSRFVRVFGVLRWSTLLVAVALGLVDGRGGRMLAAGGAVAAFDLWLALAPPRYERGGWRVSAVLLAEVALGVGAVEATGYSSSPFLFVLGVATTIAGFAGGLRIVSGLVAIAGLSVALPTVLLSQSALLPSEATTAAEVQLATLIVLVGVVGGYGRHLVDDSRMVRRGLAAHVQRLSTVNDLLYDLHSAAEEVAAPLDLPGAAKWAFDRLDGGLPTDVAAIVLLEPATGTWRVAESKGLAVAAGHRLTLPPPALAAASGSEPALVVDLHEGLAPASSWGLYAPLRARDELLGLLVVESGGPVPDPAPNLHAVADLARAAALALDNARWLERIHFFAVEQERARLARDLHDRIGQTVVLLGLEMDRLADLNYGRAVQRDLLDLRDELGSLVAELRDTLTDLRSDVSEDHDVPALLRSFADRVNRRGRIEVGLTTEGDHRLPVFVERELWRIAQEAVRNAERHSRASLVSIRWSAGEYGALLEVVDDGAGLESVDVDPADATAGYGMVGMRERADAIRAQLQVESRPGRGTTVRALWRAA